MPSRCVSDANFAQAEPLLRALAAREPAHAEAAFNLGNALRGLGRPADALAQYRRAVELRPGYAEALNNLGNVQKELGDFAAAMAAYEAALLARPEYVVAINNAGCLLRTLGRSDGAEDMLRRGLEVDPRHAALYDNLGNVLKDAGALDEAIACYRRSLEIDPNNPATHGNLAYSLSFGSAEARPIREECARWNARFAAPLDPLRDGSGARSVAGSQAQGGLRLAGFSRRTVRRFSPYLCSRITTAQRSRSIVTRAPNAPILSRGALLSARMNGARCARSMTRSSAV